MKKLIDWFWTTKLGGLYFEFLLWLDHKKEMDNVKYLTPKEVAQITRQYTLVDKGVTEVKRNVNKLLTAKTAEEYDKALSSIEDLTSFATREPNSPEAKFAQMLRAMKVKKGNKDIVTHTDRAKMIQGRIEDYKELQEHVVKRKLLRQIREAKKQNDEESLHKLEEQWRNKYGRR